MLMIDIGNSRIKLAVWLNGTWAFVHSASYHSVNLNAFFDKVFKDILPQSIYVSCVVDAVSDPLTKWFVSNWQLQPTFISTTNYLSGVTNAYAKPDALGVDRWLAMIAAYNQIKTAVCVVDCGTAITVDVVNKFGVHQGGLIMPGWRLMRASLLTNASKIDAANGKLVDLARNTEDAVVSGCMKIISMGLEQIIRNQQHCFAGVRIVFTGGDGELLLQHMHLNVEYVETLVLDGLRIAAENG